MIFMNCLMIMAFNCLVVKASCQGCINVSFNERSVSVHFVSFIMCVYLCIYVFIASLTSDEFGVDQNALELPERISPYVSRKSMMYLCMCLLEAW